LPHNGILPGWLEFNVPFQHKYGYNRDDNFLRGAKFTFRPSLVFSYIFSVTAWHYWQHLRNHELSSPWLVQSVSWQSTSSPVTSLTLTLNLTPAVCTDTFANLRLKTALVRRIRPLARSWDIPPFRPR